jgi:hypothetical protein
MPHGLRSHGEARSVAFRRSSATCADDLMNRLLIILGVSLVLLGLGWSWIKRVPLLRLPGDIMIDRPGLKVFIPNTTMLLLSALVSLVAWLLRR